MTRHGAIKAIDTSERSEDVFSISRTGQKRLSEKVLADMTVNAVN